MKEPSFLYFVVVVGICLLMAVAGLYFLSNYKNLLRRQIRNEVLRQNVVVWLIVFCLIIAVAPMNIELFYMLRKKGVLYTICAELFAATVNVLFVFNIVRLVSQSNALKKVNFTRQRVIILLTLIIATVIFNIPLNYIVNDFSTKHLKFSVLWSIYMASVTGLVYIMMTYLDAERSRKLQEKELELSRMNELKTKAELDALHSKVNPHFLYNALNSIADLSITDGKKARRMTSALADLFRYSINYTHNNYSTVNEEVAMTDVYLQIEKIRFEDQLNYSVNVDEAASQYLVPRFMLQPLVENAVKHGLKVTGQMTEIRLEVKMDKENLVLSIADNGPAFPAELSPGYGVKSVYDKLDLLFPGAYEIHFTNGPPKQVSIHIHKLMKNEPSI
jgi:two-component system, LytTR family, sensor kinase